MPGVSHVRLCSLQKLRGNSFSSFPEMRQWRIKQVWGGPVTHPPWPANRVTARSPRPLRPPLCASLDCKSHQPEVVGSKTNPLGLVHPTLSHLQSSMGRAASGPGVRDSLPSCFGLSLNHTSLMKPGPQPCQGHRASVNTGRTRQLYSTSEFLIFSKCFTLIS